MTLLQCFLSLVAYSEGTAGGLDSGYGVIVNGVDGHHTFTDYSAHPFANGRRPIMVVRPGDPRFPHGLYSTASGRYQINLPTWYGLRKVLRLQDFGHAAQDAAAAELLREHGALTYVLTGDVEQAIVLCSSVWASFPDNDFHQGGKTMAALLTQYEKLKES